MARRPLQQARIARLLTALLASLLCLGFCFGCASGSSGFEVASDGMLVHKRYGYRIGLPAAVGGVAWLPESIGGAALVFRRQGEERGRSAATLSMLTDCGEAALSPQIEANNLRLGLGPTRTRYSGPTAHLGHAGWQQGFDAEFEGRTVEVEAVTLILGACTYDWVLVAPATSPELAEVFRSWWMGFVPGPVVPARSAATEPGWDPG